LKFASITVTQLQIVRTSEPTVLKRT